MKAGWTAIAVAAAMALCGTAGADDKAKARGGSTSGGSHGGSSSGATMGGGGSSGGSSTSTSAAAERRPSSSSSGARSRDGGSSRSGSASRSGSGSRSSGRSAVPRTDAQARHPRPGTGTGDRGFYGYRSGRSYGYSPRYYGYRSYDRWYYDPFSYGYYGYSPWYYGGYWGYSPSRYRYGSGYGYRDAGSLRVIVDPEQTRVYVDGYYAGIADDFDGIFQRLYLPPGRHEITLKLEGHRSHRFRVYVPVDQTIKIHHVMQRGTGEDTDEVVGDPAAWSRRGDRDRDEAYERREADRDRDEAYGRRDADEDLVEDERDSAEAGTLRLDVKPPDASVYVDGEFRGSGRRVENLRLAPGRHRIEVVRPGYRTVERDVEVRAGEWTSLEVELSR